MKKLLIENCLYINARLSTRAGASVSNQMEHVAAAGCASPSRHGIVLVSGEWYTRRRSKKSSGYFECWLRGRSTDGGLAQRLSMSEV